MKKIPVFRASTIVEHVPPSVARVALKKGHARVLNNDPFQIELLGDLERCPRDTSVGDKAGSVAQEVITVSRRHQPMVTNNKSFSNPAAAQKVVNEYFKSVREEEGGDGLVWVKNADPKGRQVVLNAKRPNGENIGFPTIRAGDPVCLSFFEADLDVVKACGDLRRAATKSLLKLMTTEEVDKLLERRASLLKTSADQLKQEAYNKSVAAMNHSGVDESEVAASKLSDDQRVIQSEDEIVNPRLFDIVARIGDFQTKDQNRLPASKAMAELLEIEETLDMNSLDFLIGRGYWPSIKTWARKKQVELANSEGLVPTTDDLMDEDEDEARS